MISSKFSLFKDLEQLQMNRCQTDIHRAMLFADHVQPHPVWFQLDPGEGDGQVVVIMPDASYGDIKEFCEEAL